MKAAPLLIPAGVVTVTPSVADAMVVGTMLQTLCRTGQIHYSCVEAADRLADALVKAACVGAIGVGRVAP